jgi:hypothetical protein
MARPEMMRIQPDPLLPDPASLDLQTLRVEYDELTDTLFVIFEDQPAVSVPIGPHIFFRVEPETSRTVGFMFEEFLSVFAVDNPEVVDNLERLGVIPATTAERFRKQFTPEQELQMLVHSVMEMIPA